MNLFERITKTEDRMTREGERIVQEVVEKYCKQIDTDRIAEVLPKLLEEMKRYQWTDDKTTFLSLNRTPAQELVHFINDRIKYYVITLYPQPKLTISESELDALVERINKKQLAQPKLPAQ
jgi:hypothetical protein